MKKRVYYCNLTLYCSNKFRARKDTSLGAHLVMKLTEKIMNPSMYTLYFEFFCTIDLLKRLGEQGYQAPRTI